MNKIAKIVLSTSLIALFGCSGEGEVKSRINNVDDEPAVETPSVDDPSADQPSAGTTGDKEKVSCTEDVGMGISVCMESEDEDLKDYCEEEDGKFSKGGCKGGSDLTCKEDGATIYFYGTSGLGITCDDLKF